LSWIKKPHPVASGRKGIRQLAFVCAVDLSLRQSKEANMLGTQRKGRWIYGPVAFQVESPCINSIRRKNEMANEFDWKKFHYCFGPDL
jgi:hypothetical protein